MPCSASSLRSRVVSILVLGFSLALAACGDKQDAPTAMPPVPVMVVTVAASSFADVVELPGRIEAVRSAEIRARVDGIVERRLYQEGTDLPAGAPLFQIDARDYRAQLQQAQAALTRAKAISDNAASVVARFQPLVGRHAVSAQEYDAALATMQQAQASVADANAAVTLAKLRLDRCTVTTPIAGRVGRAQVTEGALVSAGAATLLAEVNQLTPINAVFTQSNTALLDVEQQIQSGARQPIDMKHVKVQLVLANGQVYDEPRLSRLRRPDRRSIHRHADCAGPLRQSITHAAAWPVCPRAHHHDGQSAGNPHPRASGATGRRRGQRDRWSRKTARWSIAISISANKAKDDGPCATV